MSQQTFLGRPIKAWTGGSEARAICEIGPEEFLLVLTLYKQQLATWTEQWSIEPDRDTRELFWNRARGDAHATFNQQ
jgi:hypothetical protein